jgi:hypothetical protein
MEDPEMYLSVLFCGLCPGNFDQERVLKLIANRLQITRREAIDLLDKTLSK